MSGPSVTLSDYHSVSRVSGPSQSVRRDLWPLRHFIRVMRRNEPVVYGGLRMLLGFCCMEAAMLENVWWQQCSSKNIWWEQCPLTMYDGNNGIVNALQTYIWWQQCPSKMYDGSNAFHKRMMAAMLSKIVWWQLCPSITAIESIRGATCISDAVILLVLLLSLLETS